MRMMARSRWRLSCMSLTIASTCSKLVCNWCAPSSIGPESVAYCGWRARFANTWISAHHNLCGHSQTSTRAAFGMTPHQSFVDRVEQLLIFQYSIGLTHPGLPEVTHCVFHEAWEKLGLRGAPHRDHLPCLPSFSSGSARSSCWLISQIFSIADFS